ncbi:MAG: hypothetical protein ABEI80_09090 [Haloplanus sp.]
MPDWSRRDALRAVATTGTLLAAGCSTSDTGPIDAPPPRRRVTDFESVLARNARGNPLVVPAPVDGDEAGERRQDHSLMEHLTATADVEEFRFRADAGAADLASFVNATDFASQSVYLLQRSIGECYRTRLVGVYREGDGVDAEFCRDLRPADVDCDTDTEDTVAVAIRLPFAGDDFNSIGSGWSGDCEHVATVELERGESA